MTLRVKILPFLLSLLYHWHHLNTQAALSPSISRRLFYDHAVARKWSGRKTNVIIVCCFLDAQLVIESSQGKGKIVGLMVRESLSLRRTEEHIDIKDKEFSLCLLNQRVLWCFIIIVQTRGASHSFIITKTFQIGTGDVVGTWSFGWHLRE